MAAKLEVGQFWKGIGSYDYLGTYKITRLSIRRAFCCKITDGRIDSEELYFRSIDDNDEVVSDTNFNMCWELVNVKLRKTKPRKVIPDIPIDNTLPILMAGHLQDRQRKQYRPSKNET